MDNGKKGELVKISYIIPESDDYAGQVENLWAYSLGEHLYELQNIPFYAEHLNVEDVVFCDEPADSLPVINRLIKWSGNRTLRVVFTDEAPDENCVDIIWELAKRNILYEIVTHKRYMFNIEPKDDYKSALNFLRSKEEEGLLWLYEQSTK